MTNDEQHIENVERLARLEGKVDTQNVLLEAITGRTREEITALFAGRREHAEKIEAIRVDYVPRGAFERHQDDIDSRFDIVMTKLDSLQNRVLKASGAVALIGTVAGWAVSYFGGHK